MPLKKPPFGGPWSLNTSPYTSISHQEPGHHTRCDHTQCNGRSEWQGQGVCWDFFGSGFKSNSRLEHVCGIVWKRSRGHFFYRYNPKKCLWIFLTNQNSSLKALHKWRKHHERVSNIRVQRARTLWSNKKAVLNVSGLLGFLIHFESEPPKKTLWLFLNFSSFPLISDIC